MNSGVFRGLVAALAFASLARAEGEQSSAAPAEATQPGPAPAPAPEVVPDYRFDVRASTYAQLFQRNLAPGANGAMLETQQLAPFYGYAFLRVQDIDSPWQKDSINAELAVWGALGLLPQPAGTNADGDIITAWAEGKQGPFHVKIGRQTSKPGAARYVRFDGADIDLHAGGFDVSLYAGWVALPRWNKPRGYYILGSVSDALKDPAILEAQNRAGQWLVGARLGWVGTEGVRASLSFHEQHEFITYTNTPALSYRRISADALVTKFDHLTFGGRFVFDIASMGVAEARVYADSTHLANVPLSFDYSFQAPGLLLSSSSILAAFGGQSWHEVGAEASWRPVPRVRLVGRAAGQAYADRPGFRGSARVQWVPDDAERLQLIGEYVRVGAGTNGYHNVRAAVRFRVTEVFTASADGAVYAYDSPVRNTSVSSMVFGNLEYAFLPHLRFMISGSLASTPFAALDAQLLGRAVFELNSPSAGGGL